MFFKEMIRFCRKNVKMDFFSTYVAYCIKKNNIFKTFFSRKRYQSRMFGEMKKKWYDRQVLCEQ